LMSEEHVKILKQLRECKAVNSRNALTISEIVRRITGLSVSRSPILYGIRYFDIHSKIKRVCSEGLVKRASVGGKEAFYINERSGD
jgi:hypothetical protein